MDRKIGCIAMMQNMTRKRKRRENEDFYELLEETHHVDDSESDDPIEYMTTVLSNTIAVVVDEKKRDGQRKPKIDRSHQKNFWTNGYVNWDEEEFKSRVRINRENFEFILTAIRPHITKTPTNFEPRPIEPHRQLALTLYRLGHGCSFKILEDVFGVSRSLAIETFNYVIRVMVTTLYDEFVFMPQTEDEWKNEIKGFIENYAFPCIGAWDGFHVSVATRLKNYYSFKHKYTVTNMGLVGYDKRFLQLTCNAPGSTHDARLLRRSKLYQDIQLGHGLPNKYVNLGDDLGDIPLVTIGDSAFPQFAWLVKAFANNTGDVKKRFYNTKLCGARVVTENAYGMMKGRWRLIYKKCEVKLFNIKYVIMVCGLLHNLCIARNDPCKPRWKLEVQEISLIDKNVARIENKAESQRISNKIADWVWLHA